MEHRIVNVALGDHAYPIHIGLDVLGLLPGILDHMGCKGAIGLVTDSNTGPLYADRVAGLAGKTGKRCVTHVLPAGEENKRLPQIEAICGAMLEAGLDRSSLLIALGGGVVGDMCGFAAACFMRGIPFVQIPTTIVAQVDSSVGGKTGVNHPLGKNTIGAFHQPAAVVIDMTLLRTLPDRELRAGMAEVIKHGVIADPALFEYLEQHAGEILNKDLGALFFPVTRSCEIKAEIVAEDERELGRRANLNYGHTFGHAIESVTHYRKYLHGEAVALGMCAAAALSRRLGMLDEAVAARQAACCRAYGLPVSWPALPVEEALPLMRKDKKARAGAMKFILADRLGNVVQRTDVEESDVRAALESVRGTA